MAQSRYYSSTAQPTVLTANITPTSTIVTVVATTGFPPSVPYIIALDYNTPSEELVLVTAQAGPSLTVTRAYDGTSGTSHNSGAGVRHVSAAIDFNDSRAHEAASTGVHGINVLSTIVGTIDVQTLTNKTLTAPVINGGSLTGNVTGNPTFTAGEKAGSTGQWVVDVNGKPSSTTFLSGYAEDFTLSGVLANTTYASITPTVAPTCVVPPSGKVLITGNVRFEIQGGAFAFSSLNVTGTSSGVIKAPSDTLAIMGGATASFLQEGAGISFRVTGIPGETLTAEFQHRTTASNYRIYSRTVTVAPLIG